MSPEYGDLYVTAPSNSMIGRAMLYRKKRKIHERVNFIMQNGSLLYLINSRELCSMSLAFATDKQERARDWRSLLEIILMSYNQLIQLPSFYDLEEK